MGTFCGDTKISVINSVILVMLSASHIRHTTLTRTCLRDCSVEGIEFARGGGEIVVLDGGRLVSQSCFSTHSHVHDDSITTNSGNV